MDIGERNHFHTLELNKSCRVCGMHLGVKYKYRVKNENVSKKILNAFFIDTSNDCSSTHPEFLCTNCYVKASNKEKNNDYSTSTTPIDWQPHQHNCSICEMFSKRGKGGRKRKQNKGRGRPSKNEISMEKGESIPVKISPDIIPDKLVSQIPTVDRFHQLNEEVICPICREVLDQPIQGGECEHYYCHNCILKWMECSGSDTRCPVCKTELALRKPPRLLLNVLSSSRLKCKSCKSLITLENLDSHENSCVKYNVENEDMTVNEILTAPTSKPLSSKEELLATHLVKRKLDNSTCSNISFRTGGTPLQLAVFNQSKVGSSSASKRTLQRRTAAMQNYREVVSGGGSLNVTKQQETEMKSMGSEQMQTLLKKAGISLEVDAGCGIAMKTELGIPWNKIRHLRRWLSSWGVQIASEQKLRDAADKQKLIEITSEDMPFEFIKKGSGSEIRMAPCAKVNNLEKMIHNHLKEHKRAGDFVWHNEIIPSEEIWIKIGGDKGGGSFKMVFEVGNLPNPNATRNTVIFSMFGASDTPYNLSLGMQEYCSVIENLNGQKWSDFILRVFLFGDYAFLCVIYGISGASGRHFCLWCLITQDEISIPLSIRGFKEKRTLQGIIDDNNRFQEAGSNLKKAKTFNNAIRQPMCNIELDQVCPPALHISIGIFNRLFDLLEQSLTIMDVKIANALAGNEEKHGSEAFQDLILRIEEANDLELTAKHEKQRADDLDSIATYMLLNTNNHEQATCLQSEASQIRQKVGEMEEEILSKRSVSWCGNGPCKDELSKQLKEIGAERQAYHSGTFNGNHTHKCLKEKNISILSSIPAVVCGRIAPCLVQEATSISQKMYQTLASFGKCHRFYTSKNRLSDGDISSLENEIVIFMKLYREHFPSASILPKMHFLEDHMMTWVKRYHTGTGLLGEQGVESIHHEVNDLLRSYSSIRKGCERFEKVLLEQHRRCHPSNIAKTPQVKRRKTSKE